MIKNNLTIIGYGKVGSTLSRKLSQNGFKIVSIIDNKPNLILKKHFDKNIIISNSINDISDESNNILISVQDDQIKQVVKELSNNIKINFKSIFVFHTSGCLTSELLKPLEKLGAKTASIHPMQTFLNSNSSLDIIDNIYYGVECNSNSLSFAKNIVKKLNGKFVKITKQNKILYHSIGVFSSNFIVTYFAIISKMINKIKFNKSDGKEIIFPIIKQTIKNIESNKLSESITGPFFRKDYEIISKHLNNLRVQFPDVLNLYKLLGFETVHLLKNSNKINIKEYKQFLKLLK